MTVRMNDRVRRVLAPPGRIARRLGALLLAATLVSACDVHTPVGPGSLAQLVVTPNVTLPVNGTQQFVATGTDAEGQPVDVTPVWSVVAGGGTINASTGLFTAGTTTGVFTSTVQATAAGRSGTATVTVVAGAVASITVTPSPVTMAINGTQQYTAVGRDAGNNVVPITPVWSVVAGGGTINSTGLFTAGTTPGTYTNTVRATSGALFGSGTVNVAAGALASISVTPSPANMVQGGQQVFTAIGRDAGNNIVPITPVWSVTAGGGTISVGGAFTAGGTDGTFTNTVRATSGATFGTATVVVGPAALIPLGAAATHGILAGSAITCVTLGTINADASVYPGSAFSGFPPCTITGQQHAADAYALAAQNDLTTAYIQIDNLPCGTTLVADLGGQTLQPGVYCSLSSQGLTGQMFFDALGDPNASFIIKAASTITTAGAVITLLNGAQSKNIYWQSGSSVTLGVGSAMKGNIIALSTITLVDNATLIGRALARNGAVSLGNNNTITLP